MTILTYRGVNYNKEKYQEAAWKQMIKRSMKAFTYRNHIYIGKISK